MTNHDRVAELLAELPDEPRWIEARAVLLSGKARVFRGENASVVRNEAPGGAMAVVVGKPDAGLLEVALEKRFTEVLCAPEDADAVAGLLKDWKREGAVLYALRNREALAHPGADVRVLSGTDSLVHLPDELREELEQVDLGEESQPVAPRERSAEVEQREVFCAFSGGLAVSFAYSYWRTESLFDISIDTAPGFRRRGLARRAVSELIRRELDLGRQPVWGAMASNEASHGLARSLGFEPSDEIVLFSRP